MHPDMQPFETFFFKISFAMSRENYIIQVSCMIMTSTISDSHHTIYTSILSLSLSLSLSQGKGFMSIRNSRNAAFIATTHFVIIFRGLGNLPVYEQEL
jgi:hypothetical protein